MRLTRRPLTTGPILIAALALLAAATGCSTGLETGYEPRTLGSNSALRRAYYAPAYTPEAQAGAQAAADPNSGIRDMRNPSGSYRH
ncbi:MAG TPA: hypothetical protein VF796_19715 [Humisphaera sp.]